jgi:hypothetical protein
MKFLLPGFVGLVVTVQSAAAAQGPGVGAGRAELIAQISAGAMIGMLATIVLFGFLKILLQTARTR